MPETALLIVEKFREQSVDSDTPCFCSVRILGNKEASTLHSNEYYLQTYEEQEKDGQLSASQRLLIRPTVFLRVYPRRRRIRGTRLYRVGPQ